MFRPIALGRRGEAARGHPAVQLLGRDWTCTGRRKHRPHDIDAPHPESIPG